MPDYRQEPKLTAPTVATLLATIPVNATDIKNGRLPVIFNGAVPRHLGYASSTNGADALALRERVSSNYASLAELHGRRFFLLHG